MNAAIKIPTMMRAGRGVGSTSPALTTTPSLGRWPVMAAHHGITPATQILDSTGRDWVWAFVVFRPVPGFPRYSVGSDGSVWSRRVPRASRGVGNWKRMRSYKYRGYTRYNLQGPGGPRTFGVHQIVLMSFCGPCPEGMQGCHNDDVKSNNVPWNLRWDTCENNIKDRSINGRTAKGERIHHAKLNPELVALIWELHGQGFTRRSIGKRVGVDHSTVTRVIIGRTWKHLES